MSTYYDRAGKEITRNQWSEDFGDNRVIGTAVGVSGGTVDVSTIWLGLNHRWGEGPPLIFETMVFGGGLDQECDRYSTEAEARAGHAAMRIEQEAS